MTDEDLIHAPAEPDLSQSGQQSSVPTRKMGQTAYEAFSIFKGNALCWPLGNGYAVNEMEAWQAAADAVIEECAKIAEAKAEWILSRQDGKCDTVDMNIRMAAMILPDVASEIRSLKSNPKGEDHDA